jgi:hypothetical protein
VRHLGAECCGMGIEDGAEMTRRCGRDGVGKGVLAVWV